MIKGVFMMVSFGFLKKKKLENLPLPPPPPIEKVKAESEIAEIKPEVEFPILNEIPDIRHVEPKIIESPKIERVKQFVKYPTKPLFVSVDDYKKINQNIKIMQSKLAEVQNYVDALDKLKQEQERAFEKWLSHLEEIEKKITRVDEIIFKHQAIAGVE